MDRETLAVANVLSENIEADKKNLENLKVLKTSSYSEFRFVTLRSVLGNDHYQKVIDYAIQFLTEDIKSNERKLELL